MLQDIENRTIFINDNLDVMRKLEGETIDLIYLDPPFGNMQTWKANNSKKITEIKNYFIELQQTKGVFSQENFDAIFSNVEFDDTWKETDVNKTWQEAIKDYDSKLFSFIDSIDFVISGGKYYLFYMAVRLLEMKRILKESGSIYLHCDNTMGHYLKGIMDIIFGYENFRNEVVWCYTGPGVVNNHFKRKHDVIFFYAKSNKNIFCKNEIRIPYKAKFTKERGLHGKKYQDISKIKRRHEAGKIPEDWWKDFSNVSSYRKELMGYPTQKPLALLQRIIKASSREGDIVLDPFGGCATTLIAAESLNRKWIGIDKNKQAFFMNYYRMGTTSMRDISHTKQVTEGTLFGETTVTVKETKDISQRLLKYLRQPRLDLPKLSDAQKNREQDELIERDRKIDEEYRQVLAEEARELKGEKKEEYKNRLIEEQRNKCKVCKNDLHRSPHLDRIVPGAQGGKYTEGNLQVLCARCNLIKSGHDNFFLIKKLYARGDIDDDLLELNLGHLVRQGMIIQGERENIIGELKKTCFKT